MANNKLSVPPELLHLLEKRTVPDRRNAATKPAVGSATGKPAAKPAAAAAVPKSERRQAARRKAPSAKTKKK